MSNVLEPEIPQWQRNQTDGKYSSVERVNIILQQVFDSNVELACNDFSTAEGQLKTALKWIRHAEQTLKGVRHLSKSVLNEALNEYDILTLENLIHQINENNVVELIAKVERKGSL